MNKKLFFFFFITLIILFTGLLVILNPFHKPIYNNSDNKVTLRLPAENNKILEYKETIVSGDNVFLLLKRVTTRENIHLAYKNEGGFLYVYQIGQVGGLIMDCGLELLINNKETLQSPDKYFLKAGDEIQWIFKCEDK